MKVKSKAIDFLTRIVIACLFPMLLISMIISLTGFKGPIQLDDTFYKFMQQASIEANSWNIEIPNIPNIEYGSNVSNGFDILGVLVNIGNFFINFINVIIMAINFIISLFTTIIAIIKLLWSFKDIDYSTSGDLSYWVEPFNALLI